MPGYWASPQTRRERSLSLSHTHTKLYRKEKNRELAEQRRLWRMAALEGSRNFFSSPVSAVFQRVNFYNSSRYTSHSKKKFLEKTIKTSVIKTIFFHYKIASQKDLYFGHTVQHMQSVPWSGIEGQVPWPALPAVKTESPKALDRQGRSIDLLLTFNLLPVWSTCDGFWEFFRGFRYNRIKIIL